MLKKEAEEISKQTKMDITDFCVEIINNHPYQFEMKKLDTDKCFFLKQGLCSIYDFRPLICRCYPFELKFDEDQQKHVFIATVECASLNSGNKRLTQAYFQRLFWLAEEKFL
jgi:Fe-S-cluster containining protein